jgi:hypothetical protein
MFIVSTDSAWLGRSRASKSGSRHSEHSRGRQFQAIAAACPPCAARDLASWPATQREEECHAIAQTTRAHSVPFSLELEAENAVFLPAETLRRARPTVSSRHCPISSAQSFTTPFSTISTLPPTQSSDGKGSNADPAAARHGNLLAGDVSHAAISLRAPSPTTSLEFSDQCEAVKLIPSLAWPEMAREGRLSAASSLPSTIAMAGTTRKQ